MDDFLGKIATGLITALATLLVCLINNYFQNKRDRDNRDAKAQEHLEALQNSHMEQINAIKQDYSNQLLGLTNNINEVQNSISAMVTSNTHQLDLIKMEIKTLSERQSAYNNLQVRTYNNEREIEVIKAKMGA